VAGSVAPRTIKQGSTELVYALITEENGQDISIDTFQISHVPDAGKTTQPGTWETPLSNTQGDTLAERKLGKLVTGVLVGGVKTKYRVFARIADSPEDIFLDCGTYSILV
jgi:hypothetical protein